jgi:hypothetical protein
VYGDPIWDLHIVVCLKMKERTDKMNLCFMNHARISKHYERKFLSKVSICPEVESLSFSDFEETYPVILASLKDELVLVMVTDQKEFVHHRNEMVHNYLMVCFGIIYWKDFIRLKLEFDLNQNDTEKLLEEFSGCREELICLL